MSELFSIPVSWNHPCLYETSPGNASHRMDDRLPEVDYQQSSRPPCEGVNDPWFIRTNSRRPYPGGSMAGSAKSLSRMVWIESASDGRPFPVECLMIKRRNILDVRYQTFHFPHS